MGTQDEQVRSPLVSLSALQFSTHAINCRGAQFLSTPWNTVAEANWPDYQTWTDVSTLFGILLARVSLDLSPRRQCSKATA